MLHFVTSYRKQNKSRKQILEGGQYGLEISFKPITIEEIVIFMINRKKSKCDSNLSYSGIENFLLMSTDK